MILSSNDCLREALSLGKRLRAERPWESPAYKTSGGPRTMLAHYEQALLHWLTREWFRDRGSIIDAGCFLGGSTFALAKGLKNNPHIGNSQARIQTFDLFRVVGSSWEGDTLRSLYGLDAGESFLPAFKHELRAYLDLIDVHEGDLLNFRDDTERDIEILFIDIAKTPDLHDFVLRTWFKRLIPGHSIVVQQDYGWSYYFWGNVAMEVLRDRFVLLGDVHGASRVYLCVDEITDEDVERACYGNMWPEDKFAAMEAALATTRGTIYEPHLLMNLALVAHETMRPDVAQSVANELYEKFPDSPAAEMAMVHWPKPGTGMKQSTERKPEVSSVASDPVPTPSANQAPQPKKRIFGSFSRNVFSPTQLPTSNVNNRLPLTSVGNDEQTKELSFHPEQSGNSQVFVEKRRCWKSDTEFDPIWKQRINAMSAWVRPGVVADYGCGLMWLEQVLPPNSQYVPIDMIQRDDRTLVIDLNARQLELPNCDVAFFSGCFEYVDDLSRLITALKETTAKQIVASYCTRERFPDLQLRRSLTWRNDFRLHDLLMKLLRFGVVEGLGEINGNTIISVRR